MSGGRPSFLVSLRRSQLASLAATAVDFCTLVFLVEIGRVWYVTATGFGAFAGAVTNFLLGRHWSFTATDGLVSSQALRYALVSGISLLLNSGGVYLFTDHFGFRYTMSKVMTAALVGVFFNFPLHRLFVFGPPRTFGEMYEQSATESEAVNRY